MHWIWWVLNPGDFDEAETPRAPNYALQSSWAALPSTRDGADVTVPELPARRLRRAAVFYLHPTTWLGRQWNGPIDAQVAENTREGGTLIQASAFNSCCEVYAPYYRQAHGRAFTDPDEDGALAIEVAYSDVVRAFDAFVERIGDSPFLVASHSQGSFHAERLLRERVAGTALQQQVVAAYLIGGRVSEDSTGLPPCVEDDDTGCVVAWNARGPGYEPSRLEIEHANPATMTRRLCTNPLAWDDPGRHVPAEEHGGALFLDTEQPALRPAFADAQCVDGALVVTEHGDLERDLAGRLLLRMMGPENLHPVEYQLFYADLRQNAEDRVAAWYTLP